MDVELCPRGQFSDDLFLLPRAERLRCTELVAAWVSLFIILMVLRAGLIYWSWKSWIVQHGRQIRSIKKHYWLQMRLPIIPIFVTICSLAAMISWLLATFNLGALEDGSSLVLLVIYVILHLAMGNVTFVRYVRLGRKLIPLVRSVTLKRVGTPVQGSSKSIEEEDDALRLSRGSKSNGGEGNELQSVQVSAELKIQEGTTTTTAGADEESGKDVNNYQQEPTKSSTNDASTTSAVVASGIYASTLMDHRSPQMVIEEGDEEEDEMGGHQSESKTFLISIALPLRFLFAAQVLATLAGCICALALMETKELAVTVCCYLLASARALDGLVHFLQLGRAIKHVKSLTARQATREDVSDSLKSLERQRILTVVFDVAYSGLLFVAATSLARHWFVFFTLEVCVVAHNAALLLVNWREQQVRREKAKKRLKDLENRYAVVRPKAFVSIQNSNNKSSLQKISSILTDDAPTYEEAWEQGFKWRRWSVGYEKKERKAFVAEFRKWKSEKKLRDKMAFDFNNNNNNQLHAQTIVASTMDA